MERLFKVNRNHHVQWDHQNHPQDQEVLRWQNPEKVLMQHRENIHDLDLDRVRPNEAIHRLNVHRQKRIRDLALDLLPHRRVLNRVLDQILVLHLDRQK